MSEFRATRILLSVVQGTHDQFQRSLTTNMNESKINNFMDHTHNGTMINSVTLAPVVSDLIQFKSDVDTRRDLIRIDQGWGEHRFVFNIEIEEYSNLKQESTMYILTGYTDRLEYSRSSSELPDDLVFYINNCVTYKDRVTNRNTRRKSITDNSYIIRDEEGRRGVEASHLIRPSDVYHRLSMPMGLDGREPIYTHHYDGRSNLNNQVLTTRRHDNNPINWLQDTIRAGVSTKLMHSPIDANNQVVNGSGFGLEFISDMKLDPNEMAAAALMAEQLEKNSLFKTFILSVDFNKSGSITWGELHDAVIIDEHSVKRINERALNADSMDSEVWYGASNETIMANYVRASIPSIITMYNLGVVSFTLTNMTLTNKDICTITHAMPILDTGLLTASIDAICLHIERELGSVLSHNGLMDYSLSVYAAINEFLTVEISLAGEQPIIYNAPLYCDGLLSHLKTRERTDLGVIAEDIYELTNDILDAREVNSHDYPEDNPTTPMRRKVLI